jgi:hypothetical protein
MGAIALTALIAMGCGSSTTDPGTGGKGTSGTQTQTGKGGAGTGKGGAGTGGTSTTTGPVSASAPGDLVITEIMNNPAAVNDNFGEWFEVLNPTAKPIDLAGLVLDDTLATHTIATSVVVSPGGYAVLGINGDTATNGGVTLDYVYDTLKFANAAGGLTIRTSSMVVIDATTYDEASGLDPDGQSRSLDPNFLSASMNDTDTHWCAASSFISGVAGDRATPGKANDPCP